MSSNCISLEEIVAYRHFLGNLGPIWDRFAKGKLDLLSVLAGSDTPWMRDAMIMTWLISVGCGKAFDFVFDIALRDRFPKEAYAIVSPLFGPPLGIDVMHGTSLRIWSEEPNNRMVVFMNLQGGDKFPEAINEGLPVVESLLNRNVVCREIAGDVTSGDLNLSWHSPRIVPATITPLQIAPRLCPEYLHIWISKVKSASRILRRTVQSWR